VRSVLVLADRADAHKAFAEQICARTVMVQPANIRSCKLEGPRHPAQRSSWGTIPREISVREWFAGAEASQAVLCVSPVRVSTFCTTMTQRALAANHSLQVLYKIGGMQALPDAPAGKGLWAGCTAYYIQ